MRIAVLSSPDAWHFLDLKRAAGNDHEVFSIRFEELAANIESRRSFNLSADCVIVRTMSAGSLQQVVFRMDLLGQLAATGTLVLNSPRSIEAAVDKYLSLAMLSSSGVLVPRTSVTQTTGSALESFEQLGGDVVVKPLFGSMGTGIVRVHTIAEAKVLFSELVESGSVVYQQEFVDHGGFDIRLLVIGEQVLGMKRTNSSNWITNISQGGVGNPHAPTPEEKELAIRSARSVGAHFAGVDLMYESNTGRQLVLEVNAVPGWRAISQVLNLDVAKLFLVEIEKRLETN